MEPLNDDELNRVLREWKAPDVPVSLGRKIVPPQSWLQWLLTGSIRVPVPVGFAILAAVVALVYWSIAQQSSPLGKPSGLTLADFQPVEDAEPRIVRSAHEGN